MSLPLDAWELARGRRLGVSDYRDWRAALQDDYEGLLSAGKQIVTILGFGALFFLVDPDAEIGVTMCSRPMTEDEHVEYSAMPAANRRRKPGSTIDDDEERARRKRTQALINEIRERPGSNFDRGPVEVVRLDGDEAVVEEWSNWNRDDEEVGTS